jgi:murein DD-endopeptidase MepM/ murein hydrolase activator NlpD
MSHPSSSHSHRPETNRQADRHPDRRAATRSHRPKRASGDYTLVHAGRQVRLGPVAFWIAVGSLVVMAGWSVLTGTYFAFQDDVLTRLIARQAKMQYAYEDRISDLRAQIDRITSRQLLDQEQFEQRLDDLIKRQATLESRTSTLAALPDMTPTGSVKPAQRAGDGAHPAVKPSPINDTMIFTAPPDREARLESRATAPRFAGNPKAPGIEGTLARLAQSLDRVEMRQSAALNSLEENYDSKARRMRGVLADLGIDTGKTPAVKTAGTGGPYVPLGRSGDSHDFERQLYRIKFARTNVDKLARKLSFVPVRKPIFGEIDTTSPFGARMDPFLHGPAIHTGLDMRGDRGDPVRATAAGRVTVAGVNGGYGKMVEIDHGNNLATRYGHLSEIEVKAGQTVKIGQIIGKIGSTGRSTGPHLHYETRVDGEAVDPQKFLRAGTRLGNV